MAPGSLLIPKSFLYLNGTTLEYEETLMRQGFVFQNPQCGEKLRLRQFVYRLSFYGASTAPASDFAGAALTSGWQPDLPATFFVPIFSAVAKWMARSN